MRARLIIKGDRYQAAKAAADRGIGLAFEREVVMPTDDFNRRLDTIGVVESTVERLNAWFTEHTEAPFPVGALLLWTPIDE